MTSLLAFIVTLGVLVVVHEYGHYRVAVACGIKVLRFSVGFGPVVWRRQRTPDSTEFVLSALPLGGYVRMLDEREGAVPAEERAHAFNTQSLPKRVAVVAAGPVANLLLAVVLYSGANWIGTDEPKAIVGTPLAGSVAERSGLHAGSVVMAASRDDDASWQDVRSFTDLQWELGQAVSRGGDLSLRVADGDGRSQHEVRLPISELGATEIDGPTMRRIGIGAPFTEPVVGDVVAAGPAAHAGLQAGDRVLSVDERPIADGAQLRDAIRQAGRADAPETMQWVVDRHGARTELQVTPHGVVVDGLRVGRIEAMIGGAPQQILVRYGFVDGIAVAVSRTWETAALTLRTFGKMIVGEASLKNLSGPLSIADYAGQSARLGPAYFLGFLAVISISLGILNLLPLPVLDGGLLMYYLFEAVTGRPVSAAWLERLQRGGVAIILMMTSLALYNDVARLWAAH